MIAGACHVGHNHVPAIDCFRYIKIKLVSEALRTQTKEIE